jgi:thymidylate synthase ThyX
LVLAPAVRLWCVGGLPVADLLARGLGLGEIARMAERTMGAAGCMSYLAMPGGSPEGAYQKIVAETGHASVAHLVQVSLVVAGVSCAAESELNAQRDLVHLARVTVARAQCQSAPPIAVMESALVVASRQALAAADAASAEARRLAAAGQLSQKDANEAANALFPAAKATAFVLTGTLRNLQKLLAAEADEGKEKEFRRALGMVRQTLAPSWPDLFALPPAGAAA